MAPDSPRAELKHAYPKAMRELEDGLVDSRRRAVGETGRAPGEKPGRVGFGLSGGGIRSATFCLGLFQGLAARGGLLRRIDYLSTVSGGGYFGGFLGRLATRRRIRTPEDLETMLVEDGLPPVVGPDGDPVQPGLSGVIRNLRENGRYLSPNGGGDLLLGGAVLLRNWLSLQAVLWSFVLMGFLLFQCLRVGAEVAAHRVGAGAAAWAFTGQESVALSVWWSPIGWLALAVFVFLALPLSWSYWLVRDVGGRMVEAVEAVEAVETDEAAASEDRGPRRDPAALLRFLPVLIVAGTAGAWIAYLVRFHGWRGSLGAETFWIAAALVVIPLLAVVYWTDARLRTELSNRRGSRGPDDAAMDPEMNEVIFEDAAVRSLLSRRVRTALVAGAALLAVALVDSLGQTLYVVLRVDPSLGVASWVGGILGALTGVAGLGRRLVVRFGSRSEQDGPRLSIPRQLVATGAAILVVAFLLVVVDGVSHAVAWAGRVPRGVVAGLAPEAPPPEAPGVSIELPVGGTAASRAAVREKLFHERVALLDLAPAGLGFAFFFVLSWVVGHVESFVNRSSHHPLYTARLARAYLGASNPKRAGMDGAGVTTVLEGDDMNLEAYWAPPEKNGFPLHLINVTVNETVDGRSQVQQQDRKGTGLALGPAGLSLGVRHHVVGRFGRSERPGARFFPEDRGAYRAFEYPHGYRGEPLTLGAWIGISGAAFTTGIGFRTNLGLALLAGLANVRLGYWWDSGVEPGRRAETPVERSRPGVVGRLIGLAARVFPVQSFFVDELFARFPGTAREHWYLSDGGFFENLGGYELVRRRLPLMVVVDSTTDPDYQLGALASLVRKARLDFGAEIRFLSPEEIAEEVPPEVARHLGSLEQLRRGRRWSEAGDLEKADRTGFSRVHAALARVLYEDGTECRLLFIKPTLVGDEPEDVLDYHRRHPSFPQETTGDQFFDEAQWESYRRLGQHVAETLFRPAPEGAPAEEAGAWDPGRLETPCVTAGWRRRADGS